MLLLLRPILAADVLVELAHTRVTHVPGPYEASITGFSHCVMFHNTRLPRSCYTGDSTWRQFWIQLA